MVFGRVVYPVIFNVFFGFRQPLNPDDKKPHIEETAINSSIGMALAMVALYRLRLIAQPLGERNTAMTTPAIQRQRTNSDPDTNMVICSSAAIKAHGQATTRHQLCFFAATVANPVSASAAAIASNEVKASLNPSG